MKSLFTLKTKLVFLFLVVALVPLGVIGIFSINTTEALIENLVLRQLENVASDKAAILERWVEERKQDLLVIAGTSLLKSMDPMVIAPYLELVRAHYGVYNNLTVASSDGKIVFTTEPLDPLTDITAWAAETEGLVLSPITLLPKQEESTFRIAAPVFDEGNRIGTVFGTVGTNKIVTLILQAALGETGECYIVDNNGIFLAHKEPRRILTENISQSGSFKNIFERRDRKRTYLDYRSIEVLGTSRKIGGTDWHIVVEQDRDEAFQSMDALKRQVYFTVVLAITSAWVLTLVVSYHIVRPVRSLSQSAKRLATADFDVEPVKTDREDEIGVLCRAFADMAREIRKRQDSLEERFNLKAAELKRTDHTLQQFKLVAERSEKFAALGRLGAAVAHEIRTPLTSLKLFLESIHAEIEISPEYREDFVVAMGQIHRMETAINRLLDYTKPKDLVFSEIRIDHLVADIVSMIRPLANKQECVVETRTAPGLPSVNGDKKLLEEALVNLFINSLEAMPEKGRMEVVADMDEFRSDGNPVSCVRIDVADSGPGIGPENMDFVFEPFFTTKSAGTGLGLPMVFNTVKGHGGEIRIRNREEGGVVVSLFLPVKARERQ